MARLELKEICKGFDAPVIDRLDLTVEEGEFFVVVGPSGIGKTTLLRCIAGLEVLDAGQVLIGDVDVATVPPYKRRVAMTFESYALYPHLSVFENIASPLRARKTDRATMDAKVREIARLLRIEPLLDRKPHEISGGQKQRTALGRTLVAEPDIFLLDEPISHLDAKIRHELRRQFHTLEELRRVATVYVTHDYAEALSLGDRIGIMGHGGLQQIGTAREVFERPLNLFVARHMGQPSINEMECQLVADGDGLTAVIRNREFTFPIHGAHHAGLNGGRHEEVTVGIRPQHLEVVPEGGDAGSAWVVDARVELFEALGANGVLIAEAGGVSVTALTSPDSHFDPGQPVRLAMATDRFLYFSPDEGRNMHG